MLLLYLLHCPSISTYFSPSPPLWFFFNQVKKKKKKTMRVSTANPNPNPNPNTLCSALLSNSCSNNKSSHLPACACHHHHLLLLSSSSVTCSLFAVVSEIAIVAEIEGGRQMTTDRQTDSPYKMTAARQGQTGRDIYWVSGCRCRYRLVQQQ